MIFISCINTACNLSNETREPRKKKVTNEERFTMWKEMVKPMKRKQVTYRLGN